MQLSVAITDSQGNRKITYNMLTSTYKIFILHNTLFNPKTKATKQNS